MDKKSKILFIVFGLLIIGSVAVTYWRIVIERDYIIESQVDCDPYMEKCFIWECDPKSEVEGEKCVGNPDEDTWYFQVARRNAANIPLCDPKTDETCEPFACATGEDECEVIFCAAENIEEYSAVACNDPVKYAEENPISEEENMCENEECELIEDSAEEENLEGEQVR